MSEHEPYGSESIGLHTALVQIKELESTVSTLRGEVERLKKEGGEQFNKVWKANQELQAERDRYKEALEDIAKAEGQCLLGSCCVNTNHSSLDPCEMQSKTNSAFRQMASIAKQALSGGEK